MEIRVDTAEGYAAPKDTFLSMRIGEFQKQSRFDTSKTYKFPKLEDPTGLARIEVFQRVGHLTVSLGKLQQGEQSVEVPVNMPGMPNLPMRIQLHGGAEVDMEPKLKSTKVKTKLDAAQKYLAEHQLEEVITDVVREVIHEKPAEPLLFLSSQILKHAATRKPGLLPRIEDQREVPPPPLMEKPQHTGGAGEVSPEAAKGPAPLTAGPAPTSLTPFRPYYAEHLRTIDPASMQKLYAKFPAAPKPVSVPKAPEESAKPTATAEVMKAAPAAAAPVAPVPVTKFAKLPSVGTWLAPNPRKLSQKAAAATATPAPPVPPAPPATTESAFQSYYAEHMKTIDSGSDAMQKLYSNFPAKPVPVPTAPEASAKPTETAEVMKAAPAAPAAPAPPAKAASLTPFRSYYAEHMRTIDPESMQKLYSKFPAAPKPEPAPKAPEKPEASAKPSESAEATPFRSYYAEHMRTVDPDSMQNLYSKFPAKQPAESAQAPKSAPVVAEPVAPVIEFAKRPSVGTWLAPNPNTLSQMAAAATPATPSASAPKQSANAEKLEAPVAASTAPAKKVPFKLLPSVGTWLSFKPFVEPAKPSILERSHSKLLVMNQEELITGYECEIRKRDEEIAKLKLSLKA
eukprot:CAMPEP_0181430818 /NCGR_PEP_ID=MMETSP1110-20121109/17920_1 /TAXON_ID=174948 /ORGANISM="Symbiodinium sp., Strain CCMP421" /LENGTH=624 /DNA_ID=CAMNT_0023554147 /DNA_START=82 /DNA_END=1956 /DNA_ORIENTATION=+